MKIDKKIRLVARIVFIVCTILVVKALLNGEYHYYSMGTKYTVSASSNPFKYYFSQIWHSLIVLISFYFGFIVKLPGVSKKEKTEKDL